MVAFFDAEYIPDSMQKTNNGYQDLIEIGLVVKESVSFEQVTATFHCYIKPVATTEIPPKLLEFIGISQEQFNKHSIPYQTAMERLVGFIKRYIEPKAKVYTWGNDRRVLINTLERNRSEYQLKIPQKGLNRFFYNQLTDISRVLSEQVTKEVLSLVNMAYVVGLSKEDVYGAHSALEDAMILQKVMYALETTGVVETRLKDYNKYVNKRAAYNKIHSAFKIARAGGFYNDEWINEVIQAAKVNVLDRTYHYPTCYEMLGEESR